MRIAIIHPFLYRFPRGIERYTVQLSSALANTGAEVEVLTWQWANPIAWAGLNRDVVVRTLRTPRYFAAQAAGPLYAGILRKRAYDHVFIQFADYGEAWALNALKILGVDQPFSIVLHFPYSQAPQRYETFVKTGLASRASEIIAVSRFVAEQAQPVFGRNCRVISQGVDSGIFRPDEAERRLLRNNLNLTDDAPMILTVAALEERKGIRHMLAALPRVLAVFPEAVYVIVGSGDDEGSLRAMANSLGVQASVLFIGATDSVVGYYQAADLKLLLSKGEASPLVVFEALSCGLPVVTSQHPPFEELVRPDWGRMVDEANPEEISEVVLSLLADDTSRKNMGEAGRAHVMRNHTWESVAAAYRQVAG